MTSGSDATQPRPPAAQRLPLADLARLFLRLGFTAFGGPAAHIAMMEQEVVRRLGWLSPAEFLDLLGAANLIPGPSSTELAIFIGQRKAGWRGLVLAGTCFILPAALIVGALAWAYVKYGSLPATEAVLYGIKPVIIAIIIQALWRLGRTAIRTWRMAVVAAAVAAATFAGAGPLPVLFAAGTLAATFHGFFRRRSGLAMFAPPLLGTTTIPLSTAAVAVPFSQLRLFLFFLKVGSVLFGSGYVLLAFLRDGLVARWHWLTENQLLDAIAVGQFTPGPVFTTATFIGFLLGGPAAAAVATVGIFLPSFLLVSVGGPWVPRLRQSPVAGAFLDGVNAASLALMAVVTCQLGVNALLDPLTITLAIAASALLLRFKINSAWLVLAGGVIGVLHRWLR